MTRRTGLLAIAVLIVSAAAYPALARPISHPVDVAITGVQVGQGGELMLVGVASRCDAPYLVQELVLEVSQLGGTRFGSVAGDFGIVCDGDRHDLSLGVPSFGSRWEGGPTTVSASLSILDPVTFDPAGNATDSLTPDVPAPADVEIGDRARLRIDGSVVLRVDVRCQEPWVVQELSVFLSQGGATGTDAGDFGLACTGRWRHVRLIVFPDSGTFVAGAAQVDASFTVLDPDSFDPVDQAQASQEISVR